MMFIITVVSGSAIPEIGKHKTFYVTGLFKASMTT